jgi:uncharacterized protein (TIGR02246 family)
MHRPYGSSVPGWGVDVDARIRELTQDLCTAFNTANYDHVAALFASDGVFMPPGHQPIQGSQAIEQKFREYGEKGYQGLRLESTRVESSGDMTVEIGSYSFVIHRGGGKPTNEEGKYLKVWRRLGTWRIVADCWSSNISRERDEALQAVDFSANNNAGTDDVRKSA